MRAKRLFIMGAIVLVTVVSLGCAPGRLLIATPASPNDISGTYMVFLHGCRYPSQIDNVAILMKEDSIYPVEIFDIDSSYTVRKNIPARQAFDLANAFVKCSTHQVWQTELRKIPDDRGGLIGYELLPTYAPMEFGTTDVLRITYGIHNNTVRVYINIDPDVQRTIEAPGSRDRERR